MTLSGVRRHFGSRHHRRAAVDGVDLVITPRQCIGVVGESGSGKSTLARMIVGLDSPSEGSIELDGRAVSSCLRSRAGMLEFRRTVQYVPQDTTSSFDPRRTLRDSVRMPLRTLYGLGTREVDERFDELAESLALSATIADRRPAQVSGGQRQRFAIARAMIVKPRLIVCDEVVSALDVSVQGSILNLLKAYMHQEGAALVFVSHGLPATAFISTEMVVMNRGRIVERGATEVVVERPEHEYTRSLLEAYSLGRVIPADRTPS